MAGFLGVPKVQFFKTGTSEFLASGKLYSYIGGTTTPLSTYPTLADEAAGTNANANPVILDARGEANVVLSGDTKLVLKDSADATIWTVDHVGVDSTTGNDAVQYVTVGSAVNEITITNATSANRPTIATTGTDTNVGFKVLAKGSGTLNLDAGASGGIIVGNTSSGSIQIRRASTFHSTLNVTGNATLSSTLASGAQTITGALAATGAVSSAGLTTTGNTSFIPLGACMWYGGTSVPTGWLECAGAAINRTTYASLFSLIGTTFGVGDGSTTFNLPDMSRRVTVGVGGSGTATLSNTVGSTGGAETHSLTSAEVAAHTHSTFSTSQSSYIGAGGTSVGKTVTAPASGSAGSGTAHNNVQPSIVLMFIMRVL